MENNQIRVLHISDLHYGKDLTMQTENLEKFLEDIEKQEKVDIIIFSGDLVNIGGYENFILAKENFIEKLLQKTGLNYEQFFISPGNHDLNRNKFTRYEDKLKDDIKTKQEIDDVIKYKNDNTFLEKLDDFNKFKEEISKNTISLNKIYSTHIINIKGKKIGIGCMNSTLFCKGKDNLNKRDHGSLMLGEEQIIEISQDLKECEIKIGVFHHETKYFREEEQREVQTSLYEKYDLLLTGHFHDSRIEESFILNQGIVKSMAGCLYHNSNSYHGYSIINIKDDEYKIECRTYYPKKRKYDRGIDVLDDGEIIIKKKIKK